MTQDFLAERQSVIDACLQLAEQGFLAGTGGNLALRLDAEHFAVTPSAADYYTLAPADIAVLRLDTLAQVAGSMAPSVESGLHATLLRAKPRMQASVHTHQPVASAMALLNRALPLDDPADVATLGPCVEIVGYAPSGTGLLVRALRRRLRPEVNAYLLRNHGLICTAASLAQAVGLVARIERAAAVFLLRRASHLPSAHPLRVLAQEALGS
jgi:L-fuculose-phosphate aldolase